MFNTFDGIAFDAFPGLKDYWRRFEAAGAGGIHLAGSGPTLLSAMDSELSADKLQSRLCQQGLEAYNIATCI